MTLDPTTFSDEELDATDCNGCGPKWGWLHIPNYAFGNACYDHDAGYWIGGTKVDRKRIDAKFFKAMLAAAKLQVWYYRIHLECVARRWYWLVRMGGGGIKVFGKTLVKPCFHQGEPRTRADLDRAVEEYRQQEAE
jgi:hypothetical protein